MLPPYDRTLITRPLMPTSPNNLLRDPLIGGEGNSSYGQYRAFFLNGATIPLVRTFQSVSPVGGAVSIEEFRDLPSDAGTSTSARVMASFHGGPGEFEASIWLSAGDVNAAPVPLNSALAAIDVVILGNDQATKVVLEPSSASPTKFGAREWMQFTTQGTTPIPSGGWLLVTVKDFKFTLQLAAPEVTSSALTGKSHRPPARRIPMTETDRRVLAQARLLDQNPADRPPVPERDDR